ncbi:MAG: hypothetical protein Q9217_000877 [Psora testacea]
MLIRLFAFLAAVASCVLADVEFTSPSAGATVAGGKTLAVEWKDSGDKPPISQLTTYQLFLCAGGNDQESFIQLAPIVTQGQFSKGDSASGTVQLSIGGSDENAYNDSFLKMISTAPGGTVINYSDRFTLTGMTGTFPPNVETGIKEITGTSGPKTENNVDDNADGASGGSEVPYSMQTGPTRYAPMQVKPGTKITAKSPTMPYPTSSAELAKTFLPPPKQVTTITMSVTYAASSIENMASPAPPPDAAMQKVLKRWRD